MKQFPLIIFFCLILSSCSFKDQKVINGLLHITDHDIKVEIGQIDDKAGHSVFLCRIKNISNRVLYIGDLTVQNYSGYYVYQGHRCVGYSVDMGSNNLKALEPNRSIDKVLVVRELIPKDLVIRISFEVPRQIDAKCPYIRITDEKAILFLDLTP